MYEWEINYTIPTEPPDVGIVADSVSFNDGCISLFDAEGEIVYLAPREIVLNVKRGAAITTTTTPVAAA